MILLPPVYKADKQRVLIGFNIVMQFKTNVKPECVCNFSYTWDV